MYRLNMPTVTSKESYDAAVDTIRLETRRTLYKNAETAVQKRCMKYDQLASTQRLAYAVSKDFNVSSLRSPNSMADLYDKQFTGRLKTQTIRDSILNAAPNSLCPYCGEGSVAELDHYLPKSNFAGTTVHPANLVPCCRDCNYIKKAYQPDIQNPAVLHPYYDDVFSIKWLGASLVKNEFDLPVIVFFVSLDKRNRHLEGRLKAHMAVFGLAKRFSVKSAQSLDIFQALLASDLGQNMTLDSARNHLVRTVASYQNIGRVNAWEVAAHEAMLKSDWYLTQYLTLT